MELFEKNIGQVDRIVRFVLGLAALAAVALQYVNDIAALVLVVVGALLVLTAAMESCMLYSLLNINTCAVKKKK